MEKKVSDDQEEELQFQAFFQLIDREKERQRLEERNGRTSSLKKSSSAIWKFEAEDFNVPADQSSTQNGASTRVGSSSAGLGEMKEKASLLCGIKTKRMGELGTPLFPAADEKKKKKNKISYSEGTESAFDLNKTLESLDDDDD